MTAPEADRARRSFDRLVGARLRSRRRELGLSQSAIAAPLGVTFQQVQKYESGANRISSSVLQGLCGILRVRTSYFFGSVNTGDEEVEATLEVIRQMEVADAARLNRAYLSIRDSNVRKAVVAFIDALADGADHGPDPHRTDGERLRFGRVRSDPVAL